MQLEPRRDKNAPLKGRGGQLRRPVDGKLVVLGLVLSHIDERKVLAKFLENESARRLTSHSVNALCKQG